MRVVVAGGSGFLGRPLTAELAKRGHDVVVLTRDPGTSRVRAGIRETAWDPAQSAADGSGTGAWRRELDGAGAVINLAGAGIADKRWTASRKALIRSSRLDATRALATAARDASTPPAVFIQGSGAGYYGASLDDAILDESSPPGRDFLGRVCVEWEAEAGPADAIGCRLAIVRSGVVLAGRGGALEQMARPFRFFVGGRVASGRQYLAWIHRDDWIALVMWALDTPSVSGALNACAPHPVTNADLSRALARALHRPNWAPVPAVALRLLFGQLAQDLLITGQRVVPRRVEDLGFRFAHATVDDALADLLG